MIALRLRYARRLRRTARPSGSIKTIFPDASEPQNLRIGVFSRFGREVDMIVSRRKTPTDKREIKATKRRTSVQIDPVMKTPVFTAGLPSLERSGSAAEGARRPAIFGDRDGHLLAS